MIRTSTFRHLRIPFSLQLMPVFLFAVSQPPHGPLGPIALIFFILHFLVFPASQGYNSFYDRDEGSIGGLEKPPPVEPSLYWVALTMDLTGIGLSFLLGWRVPLLILTYILVSRSYSYPKIRLKKYPWLSWFVVSFFQGFFLYLLTYYVGTGNEGFSWDVSWLPATICFLVIGAGYPVSQIYQHDEDLRRGDHTLSSQLGVTGTFIFSGLLFAASLGGFCLHFYRQDEMPTFLLLQAFLVPSLVFFYRWFLRTRKNPTLANHGSAMRFMGLSTCAMNLFFGGLFLYSQFFK